MNGAEFTKAQVVLRETKGGYCWARCEQCNDPATHFVQKAKDEFSIFCDKDAPKYAELINPSVMIPGGRDPVLAPQPALVPWQPENLEDTVSKLSGPGVAQLRSKLAGQFGIRLQSTGITPNAALTRVIFQTIGASHAMPYLVKFEQIILDSFTGEGQFDLVERDARRRSVGGESAGGAPILTDTSGVMNFQTGDAGKLIRIGINPGRVYKILSRQSPNQVTLNANITLPSSGLTLTMNGSDASEVTIATKSGFTGGDTANGRSRISKVLTSDKVYSVVFAPGTAGDGIYSVSVDGLNGGK